MKKILLSSFITFVSIPIFAQWTSGGTSISTSQNVGIGTSSPAYKLDVNGDLRSKNIILSQGNQITRELGDVFTYQDKNVGHYSFGWMPDSWRAGGGTLWQSGYAGIKFFTGGKPRISINFEGNVGVGTENPQSKLDVNGDIRGNKLYAEELYLTGNFRSQDIILPQGNHITRELGDVFTYQDKNVGHYSFGWMPDSWRAGGGTLWQSGYAGIKFFTGGKARLNIDFLGNVGIGTDNPKHKLEVAGTIRATEVKVEALPWADFVFDENYKLLSLEEVKAHIEEHKHLPDVPSEKDVAREGVNLAEMQAKLLQKIEELTLYVIQQDEKNKALQEEVQELKRTLLKD